MGDYIWGGYDGGDYYQYEDDVFADTGENVNFYQSHLLGEYDGDGHLECESEYQC